MNLIEKLKKIPKIPAILFLSASILFGGCATEPVRTEFRPIGIERTVTKSGGYEKIQKRIFNILNPYLENEIYKINIKESLKETDYRIIHVGKEKEFKEIEINEYFSPINLLAPALLGLVGTFVGSLFDSEENDSEYNNDSEESVNEGALIGFLVGAGLGLGIIANNPITTTQEIATGRKKTEFSSVREQKEFLNDRLIYENEPARNIEVMITHNYKKGIMKTDYSGLLFINEKTAEFFGISWSPSKEVLKRNINYFNPLINQIKPNTLEKIKPELDKNISPRNLEFMLETIEKPSSALGEIENDSKKVLLKGYYLSDEAVYKVVREFVDSKINSRIKILELSVQDIITHVPIDGSNFKIETEAPSKSYLAGEFFTGKIKNYVESYIKNYITRDTLIENCDRIVRFNVYAPSRIFLEVTHPDYKFVSGEIFVNDNMKKIVYMLDKGTKIRVEEESKQGGRIE